MFSIENQPNEENRARRGLGRAFGNLASILYGTYSRIDTQFIFNKVLAIAKSKVENINFVSRNTRIIQLE